MAGGFGSRLMPLTKDVPKPMVRIIDKPIMEYTIELLKKYGIRDIAVTLGYKGNIIEEYFGDGARYGVNLRYFYEETPLGTAGGVKNAMEYLDEPFVIISGDALTNVDLNALINTHYRNDAMLTMAVCERENPIGLGIVKLEGEKIVGFEEKPPVCRKALVNMGIYVADTRIFDYIPYGKYDFSRDLFPVIMSRMFAERLDNCYWSDIGTLASYYLTNYYVVSHCNDFNIQLGVKQ